MAKCGSSSLSPIYMYRIPCGGTFEIKVAFPESTDLPQQKMCVDTVPVVGSHLLYHAVNIAFTVKEIQNPDTEDEIYLLELYSEESLDETLPLDAEIPDVGAFVDQIEALVVNTGPRIRLHRQRPS